MLLARRPTYQAAIESYAIHWILETSTEPEIIVSAIDPVPQVQWTEELAAASLLFLWHLPEGGVESLTKAYIHLGMLSEIRDEKLLVSEPCSHSFTRDEHSLVIVQAFALFQDLDETPASSHLTFTLYHLDQMDLTHPWFFHVFPLLLKRSRICFPDPQFPALYLALERCMKSYSQDLSHSFINELVSLAILLHTNVDLGVLALDNNWSKVSGITYFILTTLHDTLLADNTFKELLKANVENALRILPLIVTFCEAYPYHDWPFFYEYMLWNKDIFLRGVRLFFLCLHEYTVVEHYVSARSFLHTSLSRGILEPLREHSSLQYTGTFKL